MLFALLLVQAGVIEVPGLPSVSKVDRVTYVYEKNDNSVPRPVSLEMVKLNDSGIIATEFEVDAVDGNGEVPEQYKIAREAALASKLPCLVVQSGSRVVRVVDNPQTADDMRKAVQ